MTSRKQKSNMSCLCTCEWCTIPTVLNNNSAIKLPCYIRYGQGQENEKNVIACIYNTNGEEACVIFPNGSRFQSLTSAGKYAHKNILKKETSDGNNGLKRWRVNLKFCDDTERPVSIKLLKDKGIEFENGLITQLSFKSDFCKKKTEKVADKTLEQLFMKNYLKRKEFEPLYDFVAKKTKFQIKEDEYENEYESEVDIDLNSFVIDVEDKNIPGNEYYNKIVYGRQYIKFSNVSEDSSNNSYFNCTLRDEFVNVSIPKCVLLSLHQYRNCCFLEKFRNQQ